MSIGLRVLLQRFPEGFITGRVPASCFQSPPGSARVSARKPLSSSSQRTPSTASKKPFIPQATSVMMHREKFTLEGIMIIMIIDYYAHMALCKKRRYWCIYLHVHITYQYKINYFYLLTDLTKIHDSLDDALLACK